MYPASDGPHTITCSHASGGAGSDTVESERWQRFRSALTGKRLLLVDDDPDMLELLASALEGMGAQVLLADSAPAALSLYVAQPPDVVVSDIGMPGEDGFSLITRIRSLPQGQGANVPAIALTAYVGREVRARALRCGFDVFLTKPIDPEDLIGVVAELASGDKID